MSSLDDFKLLKTLGKGGSATVKLAEGPDGEEYAVKIFDLRKEKKNPNFTKYIKQEISLSTNFDHENIVKYYDFKEKSTLQRSNGEEIPVAYLVQEAIMGGELTDYVKEGGLSEPICRYYFKQLLKALCYLHTKGYSHRDLKLDNILLDDKFNLKIVDFGFSCPLNGKNGKGFRSSYVGTPSYMAPEIIRRENYNAEDVDLFAAAVCIFALVSGTFPFSEMAQITDPFYKLICDNRN